MKDFVIFWIVKFKFNNFKLRQARLVQNILIYFLARRNSAGMFQFLLAIFIGDKLNISFVET